MSQLVCPSCGRPGASGPCPHCGSIPPSGVASDIGFTPPPPGVPELTPRGRGRGTDAPTRALLPRLPGYEVLEPLSKGEHGVVYRAQQTGLRRTVALLLLHDLSAAGEAKARIRHEAQTLARLGHPHLVQVLDVGESESGLYLTMEFCPGDTLARRLEKGPLTPAEAAGLVEKIARAVQAAHERGVVHGRITVADVWSTAGGAPKLAGFGLARLTASREGTIGGDINDLISVVRLAAGDAGASMAVEAVVRKGRTGGYSSARQLADDLRLIYLGGEHRSDRTDPAAGFLSDWRALRGAGAAVAGLLALVLFAGVWLLHYSRRASLPIDLARADLWVGAPAGGFPDGPPIPQSREGLLIEHRDVTRVESCLCGHAPWTRPGGSDITCVVLGGELDDGALGPVGMIERELRQKLRAVGTVVICGADRGRLDTNGGGDESAQVGGRQVRIVGEAPYQSSPLGPLVFCSAETARQLLGRSPDEVTFALGRCDDPRRPSAVAQALRRAAPPSRVWDREELSRHVRLHWLPRTWQAWLWGAQTVATVVAGGLLLGQALRRLDRSPAWLVSLIVALVAAIVATTVVRLLILGGWPSYDDLVDPPLLDGTAASVATLVAIVATLVAGRGGEPPGLSRRGGAPPLTAA